MIIDSNMVQDQYDELVSKIQVKHKTIEIKDQELAKTLAKLYNDIYCDANSGEYTFGMYKGLRNCNQRSTEEEFKSFYQGQISFKSFLLHSVFVNTLCCLRRITDNNYKTQSITRLKTKVKCEIRDRIRDNSEVKDWVDTLEEKHTSIRDKMDPLLTYIDKRISHFDRDWKCKMETSQIRDIGIIYDDINEYIISFRRFYEPNYSQIRIFILEGENEASRFIRAFQRCDRLNDFKTELYKLCNKF